jgi:hypothetical protein
MTKTCVYNKETSSQFVWFILLHEVYACLILSTRKEEYRLRAFENRELRSVFRPTKKDVAGVWGKLDIAEHFSPNVSSREGILSAKS